MSFGFSPIDRSMKRASATRGGTGRFLPQVLFLLLCSNVMWMGGCQYFGAILSKFTDDPKTPAQYVPTREDMLVLIEDSHNPDLIGILGDRLMTNVAQKLTTHKVDQLIDPKKLIDFRSEHLEQYRHMSVLALAHMFKARQILYADVVTFNVTAPIGSETAKGTITAYVKIIDAQTGETRWPQDAGPQIITVETPTLPVKTGDTLEPLNDYVVDRLSDRIAELFYEHTTTDEPAEELNQ
jgi:hypothetical protein